MRSALAERQIDISHSDSLELVARQFGFDDWNTLAARIEAGRPRRLPPGWQTHHGAGYPLFDMGIDPNEPGSVTIVAISSPDVVGQNFATLMRSISAEDYRGHTLRLAAELRGEDVGYGSLWMRVDPKGGGKSLRFDNMLMREKAGAISGRFGCNGWGGTYAVNGETMTASRVMSTMMACADPAMSFESQGLAVLRQPMRWSLAPDRKLTLSNRAGSIEMVRTAR